MKTCFLILRGYQTQVVAVRALLAPNNFSRMESKVDGSEASHCPYDKDHVLSTVRLPLATVRSQSQDVLCFLPVYRASHAVFPTARLSFLLFL